jgi:hypothetical protein
VNGVTATSTPFFLLHPLSKELYSRLDGVPPAVVKDIFVPKVNELVDLAKTYELTYAPKQARLATNNKVVSVNIASNKRRKTHGAR